MLESSRVTTDATQRVAYLAQAEQVLLDDAAIIPVFHRVSKRLVKPGVAGVVANPLGHLATQHLRTIPATKK